MKTKLGHGTQHPMPKSSDYASNPKGAAAYLYARWFWFHTWETWTIQATRRRRVAEAERTHSCRETGIALECLTGANPNHTPFQRHERLCIERIAAMEPFNSTLDELMLRRLEELPVLPVRGDDEPTKETQCEQIKTK